MTFSWSRPVRLAKSSALIEIAIVTVGDQLRDGLHHNGIGSLLQNGKLGLDVAHGGTLSSTRNQS